MENVHVLTQRSPHAGEFLPPTADLYPSEAQHGLTHLVEQLQRTLELDKIIDIFSQEAAKITPFLGLQFHSVDGLVEIQGCQPAPCKLEQTNAEQTQFKRNNDANTAFELEVEGERLGQLIYFSQLPIKRTDLSKLSKLHRILIYPLRNALMFRRLKKLATRDALTGLNNRNAFDENLNRKLQQCRRHHRPFGLMLLDLDNFKQVNDQYGHKAGDKVLNEFSKILASAVRGTDTLYRFGGDEFAILVEDDQPNVCKIIANRIKTMVHEHRLLHQYTVTASMGFTQARAKDSEDSVFIRADKALYKAKSAGRNCYRTLA